MDLAVTGWNNAKEKEEFASGSIFYQQKGISTGISMTLFTDPSINLSVLSLEFVKAAPVF